MLAQLATGRDLDKLLTLESSELLLVLGGLPEGKEYYAELAIKALRSATPLE
jgi:hypothetical protein